MCVAKLVGKGKAVSEAFVVESITQRMTLSGLQHAKLTQWASAEDARARMHKRYERPCHLRRQIRTNRSPAFSQHWG